MDKVPHHQAANAESRYFAETGHSVGQPFVRVLEHYGLTICGFPITDVLIENGVRTQYFQNLALEEHRPGDVRLKPLGEAALLAKRRATRRTRRESVPIPEIVDMAASLPRHGSRAYPLRTLSEIRYVVIHHSGAPSDVGVSAIAGEHVTVNDWPGIGYHYVIAADGTIFRTQDLTAVTHHARQFNPVAVGIALLGDLSSGLPTPEQLASASGLVSRLLSDLGLPLESVRGHREMVPTPCPGETFLSVWKPRLMQAVGEMLGEPMGAELGELPAGSEAYGTAAFGAGVGGQAAGSEAYGAAAIGAGPSEQAPAVDDTAELPYVTAGAFEPDADEADVPDADEAHVPDADEGDVSEPDEAEVPDAGEADVPDVDAQWWSATEASSVADEDEINVDDEHGDGLGDELGYVHNDEQGDDQDEKQGDEQGDDQDGTAAHYRG